MTWHPIATVPDYRTTLLYPILTYAPTHWREIPETPE